MTRFLAHPAAAWLLCGAAAFSWHFVGRSGGEPSQQRLWVVVCGLGSFVEALAGSRRLVELTGSGVQAVLRALANLVIYLGAVTLVVLSAGVMQLLAVAWLVYVVATSSTARTARDTLRWIDLATLWWALGFGYVRATHEDIAGALPWLGLLCTALKLRFDSAYKLAKRPDLGLSVPPERGAATDDQAYASWVQHDSTLHDLSNAMTASLFMVRDLTRALEKGSEPNLHRALRLSQELAAELSQMSEHINTSRQSARWQPIAGSPISVIDPIRRSVEHVALLYPDVDCRVLCRVSEEQARVSIVGGAATLKRVVENLVINACQALGSVRDKQVTCEIEQVGSMVSLSVSDNGPGFSPVILDLHPSPLVSTKSSGSGMGLFSCYQLVKRDGGKLTIGNRQSGGARVTVAWPQAHLSIGAIPNASDSKIKSSGMRARPSDEDLTAPMAEKV